MKRNVLFTLAILVAAPAGAQVQLFGPEGTTHLTLSAGLSANQYDGLKEFERGTLYYGAFFVEEGSTSWGYYNGANRLEDAFDHALRICTSHSTTNSCTLAAVILPTSAKADELTSFTLNADAAEAFGEYESYSKGYRAFAASRNMAYGWAAERWTLKAAIKAAMGFCNDYSMENYREFTPDLRQEALADGLFSCAIVDTSGPGD